MVNDLGASLHGDGTDESPGAEVVARDRGRRRRGDRQRRRRQRLGRRRPPGRAGDRHVRRPRHRGVQRGHRARPHAREHVGRRVGRGDPRPPARACSARCATPSATGATSTRPAAAARGADRHHHVGRGPARHRSRSRTTSPRRPASPRSRINAAAELGRYGVLANTIAPSARSRMTEDAMPEMMAQPETGLRRHGPGQRVAVRRVARQRRTATSPAARSRWRAARCA